MSSRQPAEPLPPRSAAGHPGLPALLIGMALLAMLAFTWRTWPTPLVDTGRELYTAWRIMEGDALYRDVAWFNGPLSPHVNALVMLTLGPSLDAVMLANGLVLIAIIVLLYRTLRLLSNRFAATVATLVFVTGFATLRLAGIGNYNFITPYAHELTHGTLLLVAMLLCLTRYLLADSRSALALAGLCAGLACLTKPEIALAALAGLLVPLALLWLRPQTADPARDRTRPLAVVLIALASPSAIAFAALLTQLPPSEALRGMSGPFRYALSPAVREQPFYRQLMLGVDVRESITVVAVVTLVQLALVAIAIAAGRLLRSRPRSLNVFSVATALLLVALLVLWDRSPVLLVLRSAPLFLSVAATLLAWSWWKARDEAAARRHLARLALVLVASAMLAKIALTAGPQHYGFALAMPAALVLTLAGLSWIPEWLEARHISGKPLRAMVNAGTAYSYHALPLGMDEAISLLAGFVIQRTPADSTLAVLEQGAWLNFLTQRRNSTPYVTILPPEVAMFGGDAITAAFERHPPDSIVWLPFHAQLDYQVNGLRDYAPQLDRFVRDAYVDAKPPQLKRLPLALLRRRGHPPARPQSPSGMDGETKPDTP